MISILRTSKSRFTFISVLVPMLFLVSASSASANSLTLSITPTLIDLSSKPGDVWSSTVKVINSNNFPITVYGSVKNFTPEGEGGRGIFTDAPKDEAGGKTLAEWINLPKSKIEIPANTSSELEFVASVPEDAQPGGHFAAILISTQPEAKDGSDTVLQTSQVVSSLFFLNVAGDVVENGTVRSFYVANSFSTQPHTDFELRFENNGTVHVQPQGDIVIFNMWGKERGRIPINYHTSFGNVLPNTIRKFDYSWSGSLAFSDIGLYKAEVTLAYGKENRQFVTSKSYFWVLPIKAFTIVLLSFISAILFGMWIVRAYVRRVMLLAGMHNTAPVLTQDMVVNTPRPEVLDIRSLSAPLRVGVSDFKSKSSLVHSKADAFKQFYSFVVDYKKFFISLLGLFIISSFVYLVLSSGHGEVSEYVVEVGSGDDSKQYTSEDISFIRHVPEGTSVLTNTNSDYLLEIENNSGVAGTAGTIGAKLYLGGFPVSKLTMSNSILIENSVILYPVSLQNKALEISTAIGGVALSARSDEEQYIKVRLGTDLVE